MSYKTLAKDLGVTLHQAMMIHRGYFTLYPGLVAFHSWVEKQLKTVGYFSMVAGGRYRRFFAQRDQIRRGLLKKYQIEELQRDATNNIPQGSAVDTIKMGMINYQRVKNSMQNLNKSVMVIQVHDEVVAYAPEKHSKEAAEVMKRELEGAFKMDVPIIANVQIVKKWSEAK